VQPAFDSPDNSNAFGTASNASIEQQHTPNAEASHPSYQKSGLSMHSNSNTPGKLSASSSFPTPYSTPVTSGPNHELNNQQNTKKVEKELIKDVQRKLLQPNDYQDPWCITSEQRQYYMKQFMSMQPDVEGKIDGLLPHNYGICTYLEK